MTEYVYASFDKYTEQIKQCINRIDFILAENVRIYEKNNGRTKEFRLLREVQKALQNFKNNTPSQFSSTEPNKIINGLENILFEMETLEKEIPYVTEYDSAKIERIKEYVAVLGRAIKEPENTREYITDFKNEQVKE